ncbi:MAG TPA: trehalose-phosphatase [Candidatus Binatia bacterium]|nr:trehalose-phosphatase [Candidatus Solibacter sp.]HUK52689.1 trehalose-phosphatase [Candidatus Binatia bacterium]
MGRQHHPKALENGLNIPRNALQSWGEIARAIGRSKQVALFTDFDGTLARIRKNPRNVWLSSRARMLLAELARRAQPVGVVSGRGLADIRNRVRVPGLWYVGCHGLILRDPGNKTLVLATLKERENIRGLARDLAQSLRKIPGVYLESKGASFALHYRGASVAAVRAAWKALQGQLAGQREVRLLCGKKVWEILPNTRTDKWTAVSFILRRETRERPGAPPLMIYLGDDSTDELVFRKMKGGISIVVGATKRTAARYSVPSPGGAFRVLQRLKEELE